MSCFHDIAGIVQKCVAPWVRGATCPRELCAAKNILPLCRLVIEKIVQGWTPEEVAGRLSILYIDDYRMRISYEAIYQTIYREKDSTSSSRLYHNHVLNDANVDKEKAAGNPRFTTVSLSSIVPR